DPADRIVDIRERSGVTVVPVPKIDRRDEQAGFREHFVAAPALFQAALAPSAAVHVNHRCKRSRTARLVEPHFEALVAVAQVLDILGGEFIRLHVASPYRWVRANILAVPCPGKGIPFFRVTRATPAPSRAPEPPAHRRS